MGSLLTKTRVICCIFSSVFCVCKTGFQSRGSTFHVCVCLFPWGPLLGGTYYLKKLHLTETGTQSTEVPVVRFVCVPGKFTLWHWWVRGQLKAWHQSCTRNNNIGTEGEEKERRWHCRCSLRHDVLVFLRVKQEISSHSDWVLKIHLLFFFNSSESMLGLNICLYSN